MLDLIKRDLRILDDNEDLLIQDLIDSGKSFLNGLTGAELDFENKEGLARNLLRQYCRYDYNNSVEYFEESFKSEIIRLQLQNLGDKDDEKTENATSK